MTQAYIMFLLLLPLVSGIPSGQHTPASTLLLQAPVVHHNMVSRFFSPLFNYARPSPYLTPQVYALCNKCSCASDAGCSYNCHKCPTPGCDVCSCETSQGCKYNCDKCEGVDMIIPVNPDEPENCSELKSLHDLCQHGPSCQLIKATKYPNCDQYQCKDCSFANTQPGFQTENEDSSLDEDFSQSEDEDISQSEDEYAPPSVAASIVEGCDELLCQVEANAWKDPYEFASFCNCRPSTGLVISAVEAELEDGEENKDESFSLTELSEEADSCVAYGGPGEGQVCKFPFTYDNVKHYGCAVRKEGNGKGWCSTNIDINGIHVTGPAEDKFKYVGFCDNSCTESPLFKNED